MLLDVVLREKKDPQEHPPTLQEKQKAVWEKFEEIFKRNQPLSLVDRWITRDLFYGNPETKRRYVKHRISKIFDNDPIIDAPKDALEWRIYTKEHEFKICADSNLETGKTYLTAYSTVRTFRVGENHHRGNDLLDGPIEEKNWKGICMQMLRMSCLPLWPTREKLNTLDRE